MNFDSNISANSKPYSNILLPRWVSLASEKKNRVYKSRDTVPDMKKKHSTSTKMVVNVHGVMLTK